MYTGYRLYAGSVQAISPPQNEPRTLVQIHIFSGTPCRHLVLCSDVKTVNYCEGKQIPLDGLCVQQGNWHFLRRHSHRLQVCRERGPLRLQGRKADRAESSRNDRGITGT